MSPGAHLSVHQASDGRLQPYLQHLEPVRVLLLNQHLQAGREEHQHRKEVALPGWRLGITNKLQEKACRGRREKVQLARGGAQVCCLCRNQARCGGSVGVVGFFTIMISVISPTVHASLQSDCSSSRSRDGVSLPTCYGLNCVLTKFVC